MAGPNLIVILLSITIYLAITAESAVIRAGYYPDWVADTYPPSLVNATMFTHVLYAFLPPDNNTFEFNVSDSTAAVLRDFTDTIHGKSPPVKTLVSIGGGDSDPQTFARMASQAQSRQAFINSSIDVARRYGFDGVDLDWESPANPQEMDNLGLLFDEWRSAIAGEAQSTGRDQLLLTAAVYFAVDYFVDPTYRKFPVASINRNLDWINAMCYDYHDSWESQTGAHAALYDPNGNVSTSHGLQSWVDAGLQKPKLVMGLPLYGHTWKLSDANNHGIGAPAVGVGPGESGGLMSFSNVEDFNTENSATVVYDETTVSTYSYAGVSWIGYDDTRSAAKKVGFARDLGIGGYFFWAIGQDQNSEIPAQALIAW